METKEKEKILIYIPDLHRRHQNREVLSIHLEKDRVILQLEDFDDWVSRREERGFHPGSTKPYNSFENWFASIPESWKTNIVEMSLLEFIINVADHEAEKLQVTGSDSYIRREHASTTSRALRIL